MFSDRVEFAGPRVLDVRQPIAEPRSCCEELSFGLGFDVGWIWRQLLDHHGSMGVPNIYCFRAYFSPPIPPLVRALQERA
jgi:hypothetical protein